MVGREGGIQARCEHPLYQQAGGDPRLAGTQPQAMPLLLDPGRLPGTARPPGTAPHADPGMVPRLRRAETTPLSR